MTIFDFDSILLGSHQSTSEIESGYMRLNLRRKQNKKTNNST